MSVPVQVFGRGDAEPIHARRRPASEKRQGTKSRWVGALAVPRALWGIERGVGLKENEAKRSSPRLWPKAWGVLAGLNERTGGLTGMALAMRANLTGRRERRRCRSRSGADG
jgi:hypothetical protein